MANELRKDLAFQQHIARRNGKVAIPLAKGLSTWGAKKGQKPFQTRIFFFLGRPTGRIELSAPSRLAVLPVQDGSP